MEGKLSNEVRFRAKVNDRVPAHELLVWADEIEKLELTIANLTLANEEARKTIDRQATLIPREANDVGVPDLRWRG